MEVLDLGKGIDKGYVHPGEQKVKGHQNIIDVLGPVQKERGLKFQIDPKEEIDGKQQQIQPVQEVVLPSEPKVEQQHKDANGDEAALEHKTGEHGLGQIGKVPGLVDLKGMGGRELPPNPIVIAGKHLEFVFPRGKVGVADLVLVARIDPMLFLPQQTVPVLVQFGLGKL